MQGWTDEMPISQLGTSFLKQTEILSKKLEEISPLHEAPYDPETGRPKTSEVEVLRNNPVKLCNSVHRSDGDFRQDYGNGGR